DIPKERMIVRLRMPVSNQTRTSLEHFQWAARPSFAILLQVLSGRPIRLPPALVFFLYVGLLLSKFVAAPSRLHCFGALDQHLLLLETQADIGERHQHYQNRADSDQTACRHSAEWIEREGAKGVGI